MLLFFYVPVVVALEATEQLWGTKLFSLLVVGHLFFRDILANVLSVSFYDYQLWRDKGHKHKSFLEKTTHFYIWAFKA